MITAIAMLAGCFVGAGGVMAVTPAQNTTQTSTRVTQQPSRRRRPAPPPVTRAMIVEAQQRLADLGYWIGETEGKWNEASRHGLIAFQKVEGRPRTGRLSADELQALNASVRPTPYEIGSSHIEVDLTRQVLFVVDAGGTISKILPVSTGNGKVFEVEGETQKAVTPTGRFHIYRKLAGMRRSPLGLLYYPNYIVGGIAIHGNNAVPVRPASHGCIRIPMFAAQGFSEMTPIGTEVVVYDSILAPRPRDRPQPH